MAMFNICEHCGANLDPGEKCDCQNNEDLEVKYETAEQTSLR